MKLAEFNGMPPQDKMINTRDELFDYPNLGGYTYSGLELMDWLKDKIILDYDNPPYRFVK